MKVFHLHKKGLFGFVSVSVWVNILYIYAISSYFVGNWRCLFISTRFYSVYLKNWVPSLNINRTLKAQGTTQLIFCSFHKLSSKSRLSFCVYLYSCRGIVQEQQHIAVCQISVISAERNIQNPCSWYKHYHFTKTSVLRGAFLIIVHTSLELTTVIYCTVYCSLEWPHMLNSITTTIE